MKHRNPFAVFFLPFVTLGIYAIVWLVKTKNEMNRSGAQIPTAWLMIIPFVGIWWLWKYSEGVELVTGKEMSSPAAFLLLFLLNNIGSAIVQISLNKAGTAQSPTSSQPVTPQAPADQTPPTQPTSSSSTVQ